MLTFSNSLPGFATIKSQGNYEPLDDLAETTLLADLGAADHHWPGSGRFLCRVNLSFTCIGEGWWEGYAVIGEENKNVEQVIDYIITDP